MPATILRASVLGVLLGSGVLLGVGCATRSRAETRPPAAEPLRVPNVPPRVIAAPPEPEARLPTDTVEVTETEAPPAPEEESARKPPPRAERDTDNEKPRAAQPNETAASAPKPEGESILSTPETANDKEAERKIRETMRRAAAQLKKLNFEALNDNAKKDYRNAESFLRQAETALASRNLSLASDQAGKADKLARGLTERSSGSV